MSPSNMNELSVVYINIQCLRNKINQLEVFLGSHNIDIVSFSEHWLRQEELQLLKLLNYKLAAEYCRFCRQHGGVCIFVKNYINYKQLQLLHNFNEEIVFEICGIHLPDLNLIILVSYRSPLGDFSDYLVRLENALSYVSSLNTEIILLGDFNVNLLTGNADCLCLVDLLQTFNLQQKIHQPTRVYQNSESCIDNCFSDVLDNLLTASVSDPMLSDHYALYITKKYIRANNEYVSQRPITETGLINFTLDIYNFNWNMVFQQNTAADMCRTFFKDFNDIFNINFPQKNFKRNTRCTNPNWYSEDLKQMKHELKILDIIHKSTKTLESYELFKKYQKEYNTHLSIARRNSDINFIKNSSNKSRATWKIINKNLNRSTNKLGFTNISPDEFNVFFVTIPEIISNSIPSTINNASHYLKKMQKQQHKSFYLEPTCETEMFSAIMNLNNSTTEDVYGISARILKQVAPFISDQLSRLFNRCLYEHTFPNELKISKVVPLHKKGNEDDPGSYRPISIIPIISKVFEDILKNRLVRYFDGMSLFCDQQYGYLKNKSTIQAICDIIDNVIQGFDDWNKTSATLLDLSKAFDCVCHELLMDKLQYYGIRGDSLKLFQSYLADRRQTVVIGNRRSTEYVVKRGVPQGSKLGPILFLIYVNDLCVNLQICRTVMYADDTTLLFTAKTIDELRVKESVGLNEAEKWFQANNLKLNMDKMQTIDFNTKPRSTQTIKLLGVYIDSALNWNSHVDYMCKKLNTTVYQIRRLIDTTNIDTAKLVYYANFYSIVNNSILLWGSTGHSQRVFRIQKKCIRMIMGTSSREHCKPLFRKLQLMTVPSLFIYNCLLFAKNNIQKLELQSNMHSYFTRGNTSVRIPYHRMSLTQQSVKYQAIKFFNCLSEHTKILPINTFKNKIKKYLVDSAFYSIEDFFNSNFI